MTPADDGHEVAPGVRLERHARWTALAFAHERPVLSSAPVGGGDVRARRVVNLCVDGPDARTLCDAPRRTFERLAREHGWAGPLVGMMTGVSQRHLGVVGDAHADAGWTVLATAGIRNAHRAGGPPAPADGAGTINIVAVTAQGLTAGARAEALALAAEAKAAVLADLGVRATGGDAAATGTGTDAIAIVGADGDDVAYTGYHTASGQALAAAVQAAIRRSRRRPGA